MPGTWYDVAGKRLQRDPTGCRPTITIRLLEGRRAGGDGATFDFRAPSPYTWAPTFSARGSAVGSVIKKRRKKMRKHKKRKLLRRSRHKKR